MQRMASASERMARFRRRRPPFTFHMEPTLRKKLDKLAKKWKTTKAGALGRLIEEAA